MFMIIKPFKINISQKEINDLYKRLNSTRLSDTSQREDWSRGVPQAYLKKLTKYWISGFDWKKQEAKLNKIPQFTAEIDGQIIHFFHIKSKEKNAMPLLIAHGWPSSNIEFLKLIEPLSDSFDLVLPTTPGFGLSSPVVGNWDAVRTAKAYATLMRELGYSSYGAGGGDIGADIVGEINHIDKNLKAVYFWTDVQAIVAIAQFTGSDPSDNPKLSKEEKKEIKAFMERSSDGGGYLEIQKTRPFTIGYGLNDSPVAQLAWIVEKFKEWTGSGQDLPEKNIDIDQLLINISLYWFTKSGMSAANFIYDNMRSQRDWGAESFAPTGFGVFGANSAARKIMDPENQIKHWSEFKTGFHFPAMEVPELLVKDLRKFFGEFGKEK
jgi:pimeloyl-ACP methyl ester carboxylesterase